MARTLLARVPAGDGTALQTLAIRIRRDRVAKPMAGSHPIALGPADQDEYWGREMERLRRLGAPSPNAVEPACDVACFGPEDSQILDHGTPTSAVTAPEVTSGGGADPESDLSVESNIGVPRPVPLLRPLCMPPPVLDPTAFDRNTGTFFPLLCPITKKRLEPCRDQELLGRFSLPGDTVRFLYQPEQVAAADGGPAFFYALDKPVDPAPHPERVVLTPDELWARGAELCGALDAAEREQLQRAPATGAWVKAHGAKPDAELLNFYPTPVQIMPWVACTLTSAAARVGGDLSGHGPASFRTTAKWPLEVLLGKLDLILQAGEAMQRLYQVSDGLPLLVPVGERFAVQWDGAIAKVSLRDAGTPLRYRPEGMPVGRGPMLPVPSPDTPRLLLPPAINPGEFLQNVQAVLRVAQESMADPDPDAPEGQEPPEPGLLVELVADRDPLPKASPGDVVRVAPADGSEPLWCNVLGGDTRRLRVQHRTGDGGALPGIGAQTKAAATIHRRYHPGCDLRAFGLLVGEVLLANDELGALDVHEALLAARGRVEGRGVFNPANVLHRAIDRDAFQAAGVDGVIPPVVWSQLVTAVANAAGSNGRTPPRALGGTLRPLLSELEEIQGRLEVELLRKDERDRELARACTQLAGELRRVLMGEPRAEAGR